MPRLAETRLATVAYVIFPGGKREPSRTALALTRHDPRIDSIPSVAREPLVVIDRHERQPERGRVAPAE
ncbi:MAG: hypothetical protein KF718_03335 [Polyangiaceae bacterium]|nr:hypothetical protein [Polyangiaceae bacterium]